MHSKIIPFSKFKSDMRDAVLQSLDEFASTTTETDKFDGWKDQELTPLFLGVDSHARVLAERINSMQEVNSKNVRIDMGT